MGFSHRADVDRGGRVSGVAPGLSDRAKGRPLSAWSAVPPVSRCQRSMLASTKIGSSSITRARRTGGTALRSEEHTSELQSHSDLVCRLLLEKKNRPNT